MHPALTVTSALAGGHDLPLPLIGLVAIGVPALIMIVLFVYWDPNSRK